MNLSKTFYFTLFLACAFLIATNFLIKGSSLNLIASLSGVLYAFFAGEKKVVCFFFGFIYNISYAILAHLWGLKAEVILNLFLYMPMGIYGLISWKKLENLGEVKIRALDLKMRVVLAFSIGALTYLGVFFFAWIQSNYILLESFIFVVFIIAFILQVLRYMESYFLVTLGNMASIMVWFCIFQISTETLTQLLTTILFLFIGIYYFNRWNKSCKQ
ncbi:nicotinamide riboside transporter PnuC [Helicobacter cetorum]|uniref:nicotinamide riboside transporter PnuC n=1 Tax=Helicobacter cetorum TaxID=138563 RepID=UPI000CF0F7D3|nr:nicotinamide riboside transporter PnuC [Helicobacter cetorum]